MKLKDLEKRLKRGYKIKSSHDLNDLHEMRDDSFSIDFNIINSKNNIIANRLFGITESSISCGVHQFYNMFQNYQINNIKNVLKKGESIEDFITDLYKIIFNFIKIKENIAFIIVSNNDQCPINNQALDKIAISKTRYKLNPNSMNHIKVWII